MKTFFKLLFIFLLWYNTSLSQVLTRGAYITNLTNTSVDIHWNTDIPSNSVVSYGTSPNNLSNLVSFSSLDIHHVVTLHSLLPYTTYFYAIGTTLNTLQTGSNNFFKTKPITHKMHNQPIRFWAMGDMAKATQNQIDVKNAYKKYIDTNYVDGFILLGDNAYESGLDIEYQTKFFNYFQNDILAHTPLFPCVGNHDYANDYTLRTNHQIPYLEIFSLPQNAESGGVASHTERYYSFDYGNAHFIHIDSYGLEEVNGVFYGLTDTTFSPQFAWLKNDLIQNQLPWLIVSFHHPPYCMGTHNSDSELDLVAIRTNIIPLLEKHKVDLVLNGHSHSYERSFFMQNHFGMESSFDTIQNVVQLSSGNYNGTPNSCAYIKKENGTIYAVVGSASASPVTPFAQFPHNAMYTSSMENGSLVFTIEGNKLDAVWLSTDTNNVIKDKFTIIKNTNKNNFLLANIGDTVALHANWNAPKYSWSNGDTSATTQFIFQNDTTFWVNDIYNCITDTFTIKIKLPNWVSNINVQQATVYPNPVIRNSFFIQLNATGNISYTLYNTSNLALQKGILQHTTNNYVLPLQPLLPNGIYILTLKDDKNQLYRTKLVVLKP